MTTTNFTRTHEADAHAPHPPCANPTGAAESATAALMLAIHPATLARLVTAARISKVSLLDFLIDSGWCHARAILRTQAEKNHKD